MYSYIKWTVLNVEENKISVLVKNIWLGFEIFVSPITLSKTKTWDEVELFLYHHVTDVSEALFWFESELDKKVFKNLLKIDWVGWKVAINILWIGINTLSKAIEENDDKLLATIPWIGKKTALKIILEMKNKVNSDDLFWKDKSIYLSKPFDQDIIQTLVQMWYDKKKVEYIVKNIPDNLTSIEEKTVYCIKQLSL